MTVELRPDVVAGMAKTIDLNAKKDQEDLKKVERELDQTRQSIQQAITTLQAKGRMEEELRERRAYLLNRGDDDRIPGIVTQLQNIAKMEDVEHVELNDYGIVLHTKYLITPTLQDGTRRVFGRFSIQLGYAGQVHIECINKKEVKDPEQRNDNYWDYEHPHVYGRRRYPTPAENVCWGNVAEPVREFMRGSQYDAAASLVIQFLSRFNEEHAGAYSAKSWKVYDDAFAARITRIEAKAPVGGGEVVTDAEGNVLGVPAVDAMQHVRPIVVQAAQYQWNRIPCDNRVPEMVDGEYGTCGTCQKQILLDRRGSLRPHGTRERIEAVV